MSNKITFYGYIEKGRWHWHHKGVFDAYCKGQKDGNYSATLNESVPPKTLPQMAYYYSVIIPAAMKQIKADNDGDSYIVKIGNREKEVEIDEDTVDKILKGACKVKSKGRMTMKEASEFIDKCIKWCARYLGIVIPDPDPNWKENLSHEVK